MRPTRKSQPGFAGCPLGQPVFLAEGPARGILVVEGTRCGAQNSHLRVVPTAGRCARWFPRARRLFPSSRVDERLPRRWFPLMRSISCNSWRAVVFSGWLSGGCTARLRLKSTALRCADGRVIRRDNFLACEALFAIYVPWKPRCSGRHAVKRLYCKVCSKSTPSRCAYGQAIRRNGFLARGDFSTIHASWRACGSFGGWASQAADAD